MPFKDYALVTPVIHNFEKEPTLFWKINPPTPKEEIALSRFLTEGRTKKVGSETMTYPWSNVEIAIRQLALLFGGTNIPKSDEDQTPVLKDTANVEEVEKVLGTLPTPVVLELWKALGVAVPNWGPSGDSSKN